MKFQENTPLGDKNSLRLAANARWFCRVSSVDDVFSAASFAQEKAVPIIMLGSGTNIVLMQDLDALVVENGLLGKTVADGLVTVASGENWHQLVSDSVALGLYGLENLALIPGTVGAAPIQNIGAYGVELSSCFDSLDAIHYPTLACRQFSREDCQFGYRESLFKSDPEWIVTKVTLKLSAVDSPVISYPAVQNYLEDHQIEASGLSVFNAVTTIRKQKLPDPAVTPNAGSFFKNPIISVEQAMSLSANFPEMPLFREGYDGGALAKLSAAWLIDQAKLKGITEGGFSVSSQHALVIINDGSGSAEDLGTLITRIRKRVMEYFGVELEIEPRIYPA